jgi:hypothetical protein
LFWLEWDSSLARRQLSEGGKLAVGKVLAFTVFGKTLSMKGTGF